MGALESTVVRRRGRRVRARRERHALVLLMLAIVLPGCSEHVRRRQLLPSAIEPATRHPLTVSLAVTVRKEGGSFLEPGFMDADDLRAAIEEAIRTTRLFAGVAAPGNEADVRVTVDVQFQLLRGYAGVRTRLSYSEGLNPAAVMKGTWTVTDAQTGRVVLEKLFETEGVAGVSDGVFSGRMRTAVERATKRFIELGLGSVAQLSL